MRDTAKMADFARKLPKWQPSAIMALLANLVPNALPNWQKQILCQITLQKIQEGIPISFF
jgi:hypothetical protein